MCDNLEMIMQIFLVFVQTTHVKFDTKFPVYLYGWGGLGFCYCMNYGFDLRPFGFLHVSIIQNCFKLALGALQKNSIIIFKLSAAFVIEGQSINNVSYIKCTHLEYSSRLFCCCLMHLVGRRGTLWIGNHSNYEEYSPGHPHLGKFTIFSRLGFIWNYHF